MDKLAASHWIIWLFTSILASSGRILSAKRVQNHSDINVKIPRMIFFIFIIRGIKINEFGLLN
jgi:hypothetical protein